VLEIFYSFVILIQLNSFILPDFKLNWKLWKLNFFFLEYAGELCIIALREVLEIYPSTLSWRACCVHRESTTSKTLSHYTLGIRALFTCCFCLVFKIYVCVFLLCLLNLYLLILHLVQNCFNATMALVKYPLTCMYWSSSEHLSEKDCIKIFEVIVPFLLLFGSIQRKLIKEMLNQVRRKPFLDRRLLTSQMEVLTQRNLQGR